MSVTAIERPLSNFSVPGNLMHADCLDAMLSGIAPFMPPVGLEQPWYARRPWAIMNFFSHNSSLFPLDKWTIVRYNYIWTDVHLNCNTLSHGGQYWQRHFLQ